MPEEKLIGEKILVIISERIGDAIFCTPAISLLHASNPTVTVDILALSSYSAQVFEFNPAISKILITPTQSEIKKIAAQYDAVIDLHNSENTLHYAKWLNKPTLTSPRSGEKHQSAVAVDFIKSILKNPAINHPEHYLLYPQTNHHTTIKQLLKNAGATFNSEEKLIGCHIGNYNAAERSKKFWKRNISSKKAWPAEKFAELQTQLYQLNPQIKLVLTGQPSEEKLIKNLHTNLNNTINLIGKTSVLELAALMSYLKVFLTGCTGPLHIAATTDIPIVALYGPTFPEKTGPYPRRSQHLILQKNPLCDLAVTDVQAALLKLL